MPRKTKKQKIQAQTRRAAFLKQAKSTPPEKEKQATPAQNNVEKNTPVKREFSFAEIASTKPQKSKTSQKNTAKSTPSYNTRPVMRNLAKTITISVSLLSLEIVIYLLWFK